MVVILKHRKRGDTVTVTQQQGYVSVDMPVVYGNPPTEYSSETVIIKYLNLEETIRALHGNGYDVIEGNNNE